MNRNEGTFTVGDRVGAGRIPYHGAHPGCWQRPWAGTVLAIDDPRAWAGSIAFPTKRPRRSDVQEHVRRCQEQGLLGDKVPVLWDFGTDRKVFWERLSSLRTVAEDLAAFEAERAAAFGSNVAQAA